MTHVTERRTREQLQAPVGALRVAVLALVGELVVVLLPLRRERLRLLLQIGILAQFSSSVPARSGAF